MNRESYLLRQRHKTAKPGEELAAETVLESDEQEVVIQSLATEANSQAFLFTVRVMVGNIRQQKVRSTERWSVLNTCECCYFQISGSEEHCCCSLAAELLK